MIKVSTASEGQMAIVSSICGNLRKAHHLKSTPARDEYPESNHKKAPDKPQMEHILFKKEFLI